MPADVDPVPMENVRNVLVKVPPERGQDDESVRLAHDGTETRHEAILDAYVGIVLGSVEHAVDVEEDDGTTGP